MWSCNLAFLCHHQGCLGDKEEEEARLQGGHPSPPVLFINTICPEMRQRYTLQRVRVSKESIVRMGELPYGCSGVWPVGGNNI